MMRRMLVAAGLLVAGAAACPAGTLDEAEELGVTAANAEEQSHSGENPAVQRLLGTTGEFGSRLGLDNRWMLNALKAVGNWGEVFERNVGAASQLKLSRGLNALWTRGIDVRHPVSVTSLTSDPPRPGRPRRNALRATKSSIMLSVRGPLSERYRSSPLFRVCRQVFDNQDGASNKSHKWQADYQQLTFERIE